MPLSLVGRDSESTFYAGQVARFGGPVLVLGSADGTLAASLAARGYDVVGIEPSAFLLREAEGRKAELGANARLRFIEADLRSVRLPQKFMTVLAPKGALTWAPGRDGVDALLETVTQHLDPVGGFVFEVHGLAASGGLEGPMGRPLFAAHLRGPAKTIRRVRRTSLTPAELDTAVAASGLEARERYADFDGRPWDDGDDRQVVIAGLKG